MSYATLTAPQRAALVRACTRVAQSAHRATEDYRATNPVTDEHVLDGEYVQIDALIADLATYMTAADVDAAAAVVVDGVKIDAGTVTGTGDFATFTVEDGVITGITLSAS